MRYFLGYLMVLCLLYWLQIEFVHDARSCLSSICLVPDTRIIFSNVVFYTVGLAGIHGLVFNVMALSNEEKITKVRIFKISIFMILSFFLTASIEIRTI